MKIKKCCNERPTHEQIQRFNVFTCHVCGKEAYHIDYSKSVKAWNNLNKKDYEILYIFAKKLRDRAVLKNDRYREMIKRRDIEIEILRGKLDCSDGAAASRTGGIYYQQGYAEQYAKEVAYTAHIMEGFE